MPANLTNRALRIVRTQVGGRVGLMLSTCAEVAFTAERALTDSRVDIEAVFGRLGDLLAIIDFHSETLKAW